MYNMSVEPVAVLGKIHNKHTQTTLRISNSYVPVGQILRKKLAIFIYFSLKNKYPAFAQKNKLFNIFPFRSKMFLFTLRCKMLS